MPDPSPTAAPDGAAGDAAVALSTGLADGFDGATAAGRPGGTGSPDSPDAPDSPDSPPAHHVLDAPIFDVMPAAAFATSTVTAQPTPASVPAPRKRPRPGERRVQILQALATMLEQPGTDRITTAALAGRLDVSEAALYRHFASKAQMFEGLLDFIESSVFALISHIVDREPSPSLQAQKMAAALLQFAEKNPGMARVMVGDALVFEHERLSSRMNQFFDKVESQLRQSLRAAAEAAHSPTPTVDAQALASAITAFIVGRLQRFARSGFKRLPTEHLETALQRLTT